MRQCSTRCRARQGATSPCHDPIVAERFFGEVPGVPIGTWFEDRAAARAAGAHLPLMQGISGTGADGADSIVVNGGYEDDLDLGDEIHYTGAGGNDPNLRKQIADQTLTQPGNAGLVTGELAGRPVRVVRGFRGDPAHSPATGYRYDGLYRVADHWSKVGLSGFLIWHFKLLRLTGDEAVDFVPVENLPAGDAEPGVKSGIVTRVIRSTKVSESVKKLYEGRCQICGVRLEVPGGLVAEGAHIRALGSPHKGPDVPSNVLCLCPNDHSRFDRGGLWIDDDLAVHDQEGAVVAQLTVKPGHQVALEYLQFHRAIWGK